MFNILGTTWVDVTVQRFAVDPAIVSDSVFLDDAPIGDNCELLEETPLDNVRAAVCVM